MSLDEKLILVDCDGVLVDWVYAFDMWMSEHGYKKVDQSQYDLNKCYGIPRKESKMLVRMFNESARIQSLPPFRDAVKYVKKLHEEHGYVFHCITSLSANPDAIKLRKYNLKQLFGETVFERIICLDTGADKDKALLPYKESGCLWVEDKPENCDVGIDLGLNGVLMAHLHNLRNPGKTEHRVQTWKEIYELIV